jgi:ribosomal protein L29
MSNVVTPAETSLEVQLLTIDKQLHEFRQLFLRQELKDISVFKKCRRQKARLLTLASAQTKAAQG